MSHPFGVAFDLVAEAARLEQERRALLPDEVRTVEAAHFLRKIAPYLFADETPKPPCD